MSMYTKDIQLKKCSVNLRSIQLKTNLDCINLNDLSFGADDGLSVLDEKFTIESSEHKKIVCDASVETKNIDSDSSGGSFKSLTSEDETDSELEKSEPQKTELNSPNFYSVKRSRKLSDTSLDSVVDDKKKKEVKMCSVLLHDIGSQLSSDHININDLPSDRKRSSDYKKKAVKSSTTRHKRTIQLDSSSESSGSEREEIKRTKKLTKEKKSQKEAESDSSDSKSKEIKTTRNLTKEKKSQKEAESDSSDEFFSNKRKKQKEAESDSSYSESKEMKKTRKLTKEKKSQKEAESDSSDSESKQMKKTRKLTKQNKSQKEAESDSSDSESKKMKKSRKLEKESQKEVESDTSDSESKQMKKTRKLAKQNKFQKEAESDSSDSKREEMKKSSKLTKEKIFQKEAESDSSDSESKEIKKSRKLEKEKKIQKEAESDSESKEIKKSRKLEKEKKSQKEAESDSSDSESKEIKKSRKLEKEKKSQKEAESDSSDSESKEIKKNRKLAKGKKSQKEALDSSDSESKEIQKAAESDSSDEFISNKRKKQKKAESDSSYSERIKRTRRLTKEKKSQKEAESDSSDEFISKKKKQKKPVSNLSDEDEDYDKKSTKKERGNFKAVKKVVKSEDDNEQKRLRTKKKVKYFQNTSSEESDTSEKNSSEEDPHPVKRRKNWDPDFEDESSNSYEDEEEDGKGNKNAKNVSSNKSMSEYEKMLEEKKREKVALLESLGIFQARSDISDAVNKMKTKRIKKEKNTENIVRRSSKRSKMEVNYNYDEIPVQYQKPTEQSFKQVLNSPSLYKSFTECFDTILEPPYTHDMLTPMLYDNNMIEELTLTATTGRVSAPSALLWYPSAEELVLVAGTMNGNLFFWNIEDSFDMHSFSVHSKEISNLKFNPYNYFQIFSSSHDGTLLCCDMQKQMFSQIFKANEDECTYFDFFSPSSLLVSLKYDQIAIVDKRQRGRSTSVSENIIFNKKRHTWDRTSITTVNVHPVNKNYFVTASEEGKVCLWDLRVLRRKPYIELPKQNGYVSSAFFSPVTGNSILTTSFDSTVCVFDSASLSEGSVECRKTFKFKYYPFRKRFMKLLRAEWLPNSDDIFVFSYKEPSSRIRIYDKDLNDYAAIEDKVSAARACCIFHPYRCAFATLSELRTIYVYT